MGDWCRCNVMNMVRMAAKDRFFMSTTVLSVARLHTQKYATGAPS